MVWDQQLLGYQVIKVLAIYVKENKTKPKTHGLTCPNSLLALLHLGFQQLSQEDMNAMFLLVLFE